MNLRKIISKQIILEGRIEDAQSFVLQDFKDSLIPQSRKEGQTMPMWFQYLVENDPSGNQKYLMWVLKQIKKHRTSFFPFGDYNYLEEQLVKVINEFHDLQSKLTADNIKKVVNWKAVSNPSTFTVVMDDIYNRYDIKKLNTILENPTDINSYDDYDLLLAILNAVQEIPSKSDIKKESIKLVNNDYWLVVYPSTWRTSCFYGANTRWCTTTRENDVNFNKYQTKISSLFYFIPKKRPNFDVANYFVDYVDDEYDLSKIALFISASGEMTFFDASDAEISYEVVNYFIGKVLGGEFVGAFEEAIEECESFHDLKVKKST